METSAHKFNSRLANPFCLGAQFLDIDIETRTLLVKFLVEFLSLTNCSFREHFTIIVTNPLEKPSQNSEVYRYACILQRVKVRSGAYLFL